MFSYFVLNTFFWNILFLFIIVHRCFHETCIYLLVTNFLCQTEPRVDELCWVMVHWLIVGDELKPLVYLLLFCSSWRLHQRTLKLSILAYIWRHILVVLNGVPTWLKTWEDEVKGCLLFNENTDLKRVRRLAAFSFIHLTFFVLNKKCLLDFISIRQICFVEK